MSLRSLACRSLAAWAVSFFAMNVALAQARAPAPAPQAPSEFMPEVGQPGKDVVWVPTAQTLVNKLLDMRR